MVVVSYLPVTAVALVDNEGQFGEDKDDTPLILAGVGRYIEVWTAAGKCIHKVQALQDGPITGITFMDDFFFVHGHNRQYSCISTNMQRVMLTGRVPDRVIAACEMSPAEGSILLVLAHGQILLLCSKTGQIRQSLAPTRDALLYSACILECADGNAVVALGTVFSGIELVQVDLKKGTVSLLQVLGGPEGHRGSIFSLATHEGTSILASASDDRTVKVWNWKQLITGDSPPTVPTPLCTFHGHKSRIWAVALDPSSPCVLSVGEDGTLRNWAIKKADEGHESEGDHEEKSGMIIDRQTTIVVHAHQGSIRCLAVIKLGGNSWIASGGDDCSLNLCKLTANNFSSSSGKTFEVASSAHLAHGAPKAVEFMLDGALLTVLADGTINGLCQSIISSSIREEISRNAVTCLVENTLMVGTLAGTVLLLPVEGTDMRQIVKRINFSFKSQVTYVAGWRRSSSGVIIVLAQAGDGSTALAEIHEGEETVVRPIAMQSTVICSSHLLIDASHIIVGTRDGRLMVLEFTSLRVRLSERICSDAVTCIKNEGPDAILTTDRSGHLSSYRFSTLYFQPNEDSITLKFELQWKHRLTKGWLEEVSIGPDGRSYLVAGFQSTRFFLMRVNVSGGRHRELFSIITGGAHRVWRMRIWGLTDRFALVFVRLGKLYRYDGKIDNDYGVGSRGEIRIVKKTFHSDSIRCIRALDAHTIVTGGEDGWIRLSRLLNGGCIDILSSFRSQTSPNIKCIATWGGKLIFTGGSDEELCGWKVTKTDNLSLMISPFWRPPPFTANGIRIMDMDIKETIDGSLLLVLGYSDSHLVMYRLDQDGLPMGERPVRVPAHVGRCILKVKFFRQQGTNTSALVVSGGTDGLLQLHRLNVADNSFLLANQLRAHQSGINAIAVHPSQPLIVSGGDDGQVTLTSVNVDSLQLSSEAAPIPNAHHSTITGIGWISPEHFVSVAVDQRVILWRLVSKFGRSLLERKQQWLTQVADAGAILVQDEHLYIVGAGMEAIPLNRLRQFQ